jgi:sugar O-acyltransferase (sialic acid O-acetyltransferase NeuD family)
LSLIPALNVNAMSETQHRQCVIIGSGGHTKSIIDALQLANVHIRGILAKDESQYETTLLNVPIIGGDDLLNSLQQEGVTHFAMGIGSVGDNRPRQRIYEATKQLGYKALSVIHPTAVISQYAQLGDGVQILAGAIVNVHARIGENTIINTGAIIEHDCQIDAHVHIATGARLAGTVHVKQSAHIGAGATIRQGITVHDYAIIGAGAVVVRDVPPYTTVVGVPARKIERTVD